MSLLSAIVFAPLVAALGVLVLPRTATRAIRSVALAGMLADLVLSLWLLPQFGGDGAFQFVERHPWIARWGIEYHLGVDGISLWLVLLTALLGPVAVLGSWAGITTRVREFHVLLLLLQTGMQGVFLSLDLFLFYIFWEVSLVPMYFLIGIWGHERRLYAAIKFVLFTLAGSLLMLVAILSLVVQHANQVGYYSFDLQTLIAAHIDPSHQVWYFAAFALAFAIKVPLWPLHTWLPDAHVEAPTAGSVILAGILLKMGGYGFLRFAMPLFPHGLDVATPLLMLVAVVGIVYGAMVAMVQPDMKKLVAYSSVSHLGFVMLGILSARSQGLEGGIYQMLNHGLSTGALFLLVGVLYERRHSRAIADFGGLARSMPVYATVLIFVTLSSIGLPGLNGFVGEFLILLGAFHQHRLLTIVASTGVVLGAIYMLWMVERVLFGPVRHEENRKLPDLSPREILTFAPLLILIVVMGVYPRPFLQRMHASVDRLVRQVQLDERLTETTPSPGANTPALGASSAEPLGVSSATSNLAPEASAAAPAPRQEGSP
ncbi:MAG TPA: NADH-quinone oxidoreductase subunit M [Candidatus Krumholzibacteria bacterium]|nr:NADH-quinone oxidoreductase subunit M [Candidatus Krumholzibacteria bacterium]